MHAPTLERRLETLPLTDLFPHPANARGEIKTSEVAGLTESIKARGILNPLMVRVSPNAGRGFQILAGHRRGVAAKAAGLASVPCQIVTLEDEEAAAIVLLENLDREDPNLFRQAELVEKLLSAKDSSIQHVALLLGKAPRWVATLRAIARLEPSVRKAMDGERCDWTVQMVEYFAGLAPDVQRDRWEDVKRAGDLSHLKSMMGEDFHLLKEAPFDVTSDTLVPVAGSCAACPKTSLRSPGLFENEDLDPADPKALAKATCRDPQCWASKCLAKARMRLKEVAEKAGAAPAILSTGYIAPKDPVRKLGKVVSLYESLYEFKTAKKGERGAFPAVEIKGAEVGPVRWLKSASDKGPSGSRGKPKPAKPAKQEPLTQTQRLERFLQRRAASIVDAVQECVDGKDTPPYVLVRCLVAAFGMGTVQRATDPKEVGHGRIADFIEKVALDDRAWAARVWPKAQMHIAIQLRRQTFDLVDKQLEDAIAIYALLEQISQGEARDRLQRMAEKALPTPEGLRGPLEEASAHVNGPASKAAPRRARRSTGKAAAAADDAQE